MRDFLVWLLIACGTFAFLGGVLNWRFFMESRKAQLIVKLFGYGGARTFYAILGIALMAFGVSGLLGYVDLS